MSLIMGDMNNYWNAVVVMSVILAATMWFHSELLRWASNQLSRIDSSEIDRRTAISHLRWALRLNRAAHVLGLLAFCMQQTRIESVRQLAVGNGVVEAIDIADSNLVTVKTSKGNTLTIGGSSGRLSDICGFIGSAYGSVSSVRPGDSGLGDGAPVSTQWADGSDLRRLFSVDVVPAKQSAASAGGAAESEVGAASKTY